MWWSRNLKALGIVALLALAGCGFHPMYGDAGFEAGNKSALQGNIIIAAVGGGGRFGQVLKNALEDKFNPQGIVNASPDYTLQVSYIRNLIPAVVRSDGTILRYEVHFDTEYALKDNHHPKATPYMGKVRRISSYNVVPNANFATYEAEENLNERMLREIAEDYVLRISDHLAGKN